MLSFWFMVALAVFLMLTLAAWARYRWVANHPNPEPIDSCPFSLSNRFSHRHLAYCPHQKGVRWLFEIFERSARTYPELTALQIPHTGESLTFSELDSRAERIAAALSDFLTSPDQVVAIAMPQDNWEIVACHLAILKAGGTQLVLETELPDSQIAHMIEDARPVVVLTRGSDSFRDLPTLDVLALPETEGRRVAPGWLDDPASRLATLLYTSGTTGAPKGVESAHSGYVNLALSYADYFDLAPGADATTLTSSMGYDGSISEMYSAWVSGCAVTLLTKDEVRSGPELVPILREAEVTVLFCPPSLLTTLSATPHLDLPYPICRYIVPAGESFPEPLIEPWTRGRRQIINTYGPTEASTDTSRQSLRPGERVTIGAPLANVTYVILEPGELRPLPHGETGELCIGGIHVARGYRNLPEQTAERFIDHPQFGRLYRTGDRCRIDPELHRVHFLGRFDTQLKVRGHRVEVQAVESLIESGFSEVQTAVLDYQNQELVAFVIAPSVLGKPITNATPAPKDWVRQVTSVLSEQLSTPSVPTRFFLVDRFPLKTHSGKIDRENLPMLSRLGAAGQEPAGSRFNGQPFAESISEPDREELAAQEQVLTICSDLFESPLECDDAFVDHGGHSIIIAQLAQRLQAAGWAVPVRALLNECSTPRKVAASMLRTTRSDSIASTPALASNDCAPKRDEAAAQIIPVARFTLMQVLFLLILYTPHLTAALGFIAVTDIGEFFMTAYLLDFIGVGFVMYLSALVVPFATLLWVMLIKLFLSGDLYRNGVTPGRYPKWSGMHLRFWCIGRLEQSVLLPFRTMFRSAPLMAYVLRQLGARVGSNLQCAHDVAFSGPLDLFTAGDDVTLQSGVYIQLSRWQGQALQIGPIQLESGCKIGMRAAVSCDVTVGPGAWIHCFTPILEDVGPNEMWEGAPAEMTGLCTALRRTANGCRYRSPFWLLEAQNIAMQVFLDFWLIVAPTALVTWFASNLIPVTATEWAGAYFETTPLSEIVWQMGVYAFVTSWVSIVLISLLSCLFLRFTPQKAGIYPSRGLRGALLLYRMKRLNRIQRQWTWTITGQYLRALAGVRFSRTGASECDVMFNLIPEMASADAQIFWSNGCFTNMLDYGAEHFRLRRLDMPQNFFAGNNCVVESGQFPTNFLLGVSSPGNDLRFRRHLYTRLGAPITVAGNPPIRFASADFEAENETQRHPGFALFLTRVFLNDVFSIGVLPTANLLVFVIIYTNLLRLGGEAFSSALLGLILSELTLVIFCALIKKILVGRNWGQDHSTPFWSWRHFSYFFAQDCFFSWCRLPLGILSGTVLSNVILRWMGCEVGNRSIVLSPLQACDWNAVKIGDDCLVGGFLQYHTFENMMLKVKRTEIGDGSAVNIGATIMGGATLEPGTNLWPLSLVLKQMHLTPEDYVGSPAEPATVVPGQA